MTLLQITEETKPFENVETPSRFPKVTIPGMGVAQVILHYWFRVEKHLWEVVDGGLRLVVSVTYFRLWLPVTKQFWSYRVGTENLVPHDAVVIFG